MIFNVVGEMSTLSSKFIIFVQDSRARNGQTKKKKIKTMILINNNHYFFFNIGLHIIYDAQLTCFRIVKQ
jgi:hypothetical protein